MTISEDILLLAFLEMIQDDDTRHDDKQCRRWRNALHKYYNFDEDVPYQGVQTRTYTTTHYNGDGVPHPTSKGEIWVFDKNHTE